MAWFKWAGLALLLLALVGATLALYGANRWNTSTQTLLTRLEMQRLAVSAARYDERELDKLPAPVQRYLRAVLVPGQAIVDAAMVEHSGSFNMSPDGEQWRHFDSQQRVVTHRPGFVWNARIQLMPGVGVDVHDAYVGGQGLLHAAVLGLVDMADLSSAGELARGELMRYFAEAAWYPTALLPSQGVQWKAVNEHCARATLVDGPIELTLLFGFSDDGLIDWVRADARGRLVGKQTTMAPWEGRWSNYQRRDGMLVPITGEVAWLLPQGRFPYWRGSITSLRYEFGI